LDSRIGPRAGAPTVGIVVAVLILLWSTPTLGDVVGDGHDHPGALGADRAAVERELVDADASFDAAMARIRDLEAELAEIDERIIAASGELAAARARADALRAGAQAAQERAAEASAEAMAAQDRADTAAVHVRAAEVALVTAGEELVVAEDTERASVERLQSRAIGAFKHGAGQPLALAGGMLGATDWHDVGLTVAVLVRVLDEDRTMVRSAEDARLGADRARRRAVRAEQAARSQLVEAERAAVEADRAEEAAQAAAELAAQELADAEAAETVHRQTSAQLQEERSDQAALIASLEDDAVTAAARRVRLEERLATLDVLQDGASSQPPPSPAPGRPPDGGLPSWAAALPAVGQAWVPDIIAAANANGVDPRLLAAVVWTESAFSPTAVSSAGAIGLAQLMPDTARGLGVDPWDPRQNLDGGARYLAAQTARFGSVTLGLAAYNAGPGAVQRHGGIPPFFETQNYVPTVLERYYRLLA